jgi:hypothetical protein
MRCSICGAENATMRDCPANPNATRCNLTKHPTASLRPMEAEEFVKHVEDIKLPLVIPKLKPLVQTHKHTPLAESSMELPEIVHLILNNLHTHELVALRGVSRLFRDTVDRIFRARGFADTYKAMATVATIPNSPAKFVKITEGKVDTYESYNEAGQIHSDMWPARIVIGRIVRLLEWYRNGKLHRLYGPARIVYHTMPDPNIIKEESWYYQGELHNSNGYAKILFDTKGNPILHETHIRGHLRMSMAPKSKSNFNI